MKSSEEPAVSRIVVVDSQAIIRSGVIAMLRAHENLEVIGQAGTAKQALELIDLTVPDLVVTDSFLPDGSGLEFLREVLLRHPQMAILVLSRHDEKIYAERALRAGAKGYLMKTATSHEIYEAIARILAGDVSTVANAACAKGESVRGETSSQEKDVPIHLLSDRELRIFELIGEAMSNQQIGEKLGVNPRTIDAHKSNIKEKLGISGNGELLKIAVRCVDQWRI